MRMSRLAILFFFVALVVARGAGAAEPALVPHAEEVLRQAGDEKVLDARHQLVEQAQALCEKAVAQAPADPVPLIVMAQALSLPDPPRPELCRPGGCEKAVQLLTKARALDKSGVEARRIADELAIVYSRLGQHADALAEYQRGLKLVESSRHLNFWDETNGGATLYGNAAETLMALGRLDESIESYRRSLELSEHHDLSWELANWGLGVSLDRDEQEEASRSAVRRALDIDPAMRRLSQEGVFFEPPGDRWAYLALGHEVAGDRDQAISAWRTYLAGSPPNARYARRARAHLEADRRGLAQPGDLERLKVEITTIERLGGGRNIDDLRQSLRGYVEDLRLCYARALRSHPNLVGGLMLALDFHPFGFTAGGPLTAPRVLTERSTLAVPALSTCIEGAASAWRFRPLDGVLNDNVIVTIELAPK